MTTIPLSVKPGFLIQNASGASGGVSYSRKVLTEERDGARYDGEFQTHKVVDNEPLVEESKTYPNQAWRILTSNCSPVGVGWYADAETLRKVRALLAPVAAAADDFNRRSRAAGSNRRARVGIVPLPIAMDDVEAARAIADSVCESLTLLREAVAARDLKASLHVLKQRCQNLHKLATGIQADSIRFAVDEAIAAREEVKLASREEREPSFSTDALDSAIALFTRDEDAEVAGSDRVEAAS